MVVYVHHHILFLLQVPPLLSPVYPKFFLQLFQYSLKVSLDTAWKVPKYREFSGPYFHTFGLNTERYSVSLRIKSECGKILYLDTFHAVRIIFYWKVNKERFLLNLCNGAHCCLRLSCISLEQEVQWTIRSLSVFDILSITGPLEPRTISYWRGFTYIIGDFDSSFISGMVYHFRPTIIVESGRIPLPPERHLTNWNTPLWDYNFIKGFSKAPLMHLWLPFFSII